jgi:Zn-dependent protease/CBS domain-containing protein
MDPSWLFLAFLLVFTLSRGLFPNSYPGLTETTYFWMGILGMLGLFGSIVLHEFGHAWVAQRFGLPMRGITLFLFGGVAEMSEESPGPAAEFWMAIAGPTVSALILICCLTLSFLGKMHGWPVPFTGLFTYIAFMNGILIAFNLVPAFPLDGGRILRAALWQWKKSLPKATRIASTFGKWFGSLLIFMGIFNAIQGEVLGGIWWVLIGLFLRQSADASYKQILFQQHLEGKSLKQFVKTDVVTVPSNIDIRILVDEYFHQHYFKGYPVLENGELAGYIAIRQIRQFPTEEWTKHAVKEIMVPATPDNTISSQSDAMTALTQIQKTGLSTLMVVEGRHLVGLLSLKDLLRFLSMELELEDEGSGSATK